VIIFYKGLVGQTKANRPLVARLLTEMAAHRKTFLDDGSPLSYKKVGYIAEVVKQQAKRKTKLRIV